MKENIPVLLLKKLTLLPLQEVRLELNNKLSKKIIDLSIADYNNKVLVIFPKNPLEENLNVSDLPAIGIIAYIKSKIVLPNENYRVVLKGLNRINVIKYLNYKQDKNILLATSKMLYIDNGESVECIALKNKLLKLIKSYINHNSEIDNSILSKINNNTPLDELTDIIVDFMHFSKDKIIDYMSEIDEIKRARTLIKDLNVELEIIKLNNKIDDEIKKTFEKEQKEYLVKQKIAKLNEEIGLTSSKENEILSLKGKIDSIDAPDFIKKKLNEELKKYEYTPTNSPELSMIRNYIECLLSMPYRISDKEEMNPERISKALNSTHFGLDNIKKRIIEYSILKKNNKNLTNPIICLVGPPGIGKTTIAQSIAKALKRKFAKISVGGMNDPAELLGHTRTYLGSAPGKIIKAIQKCETNNPVILIDEIDKMSGTYQNDPTSTLVDILDPNQNVTFTDNYIEEPFDLSNVLFILTANDFDKIPEYLRDRLEIIFIPSYTIYDKVKIANNYIINYICDKYAYDKIELSEEIIKELITNYTLESGVRELSRVIDKIVRFYIINNKTLIEKEDIITCLGNPIFEDTNQKNNVGESSIVGVSPLGGLNIKVQCAYNNTNTISISGNVGEELRDTINLCIAYLNSKKLLSTQGIHLNFTKTKYMKEGSSGACGILSSILSLETNKVINNAVGFLGAIDLYGNVLKVSKFKEKVITAYNNNLKILYVPEENKKDELSIPDFILKELNIIYISNYEEIMNLVFKKK